MLCRGTFSQVVVGAVLHGAGRSRGPQRLLCPVEPVSRIADLDVHGDTGSRARQFARPCITVLLVSADGVRRDGDVQGLADHEGRHLVQAECGPVDACRCREGSCVGGGLDVGHPEVDG
jgi:hypothetical protein